MSILWLQSHKPAKRTHLRVFMKSEIAFWMSSHLASPDNLVICPTILTLQPHSELLPTPCHRLLVWG